MQERCLLAPIYKNGSSKSDASESSEEPNPIQEALSVRALLYIHHRYIRDYSLRDMAYHIHV